MNILGECTVILTKGPDYGRQIFMLPQWKTLGLSFWLKAWKPSVIEGISFIFQDMNASDYYRLDIGAEKNEKVALYYVGDKGIKITIITMYSVAYI